MILHGWDRNAKLVGMLSQVPEWEGAFTMTAPGGTCSTCGEDVPLFLVTLALKQEVF